MDALSSTRDYLDARGPEFQAVIIVDYDNGRLYPLTENTPKCLLPIANRKLLAYQLDMLTKNNISETFIVAPSEFKEQLSTFLGDYDRGAMKIDLIGVEDFNGSADAIREVAHRIRSDFFCISGDFLSQFSFIDMAHMHRLQVSDCTIFFSVPAKETVRDDSDREYVGFGDNGRLLMKIPVLDIEDEHVELPKCLLNRTSSFSLRDDLMDMGVYLLSPWVVDVIVTNPHISSLKSDLLPFLLDRQYQPMSYLRQNLPSLQKRNRPLSTIEPWLTATQRPFSLSEGAENQAEETASFARSVSMSALSATASSVDISDNGDEEEGDYIRCFGLVYDPSLLDSSVTNACGGIILTSITNVPSYLALNKEIPLMQCNSRTPWTKVSNYQKKESSVIGENVDLTDKSITFKQTCIGTNCRIGTKTKLNNCVIMDNAVIGDNCTIQNTVIGERAVIENNCNINECVVGSGCKVNANSRIKGEQISQSFF